MIDTNQWAMGGNNLDVEIVHLSKITGLSGRRAGHAAHGRIKRDQVLHSDRTQDSARACSRHSLLRLDRGLQTPRPSTLANDTALELVDREHLPVVYHVVDVATQQDVGVQRLLDGCHNRAGIHGVEVAPEQVLDERQSRRQERHVAAAAVDGIVAAT